jgi:hypothetical protein
METVIDYLPVYIKRHWWSKRRTKVLRPVYKWIGIGGCKDRTKFEVGRLDRANY